MSSTDHIGHTHEDSTGRLHACYHACKRRWYLWAPLLFVSQVLMFPLEHKAATWAWQQPGLDSLAHYLQIEDAVAPHEE